MISLLVAAIVLSNCISWTASRHHYRHKGSGHRTRHRRQGAGLYLPASYVIPGGEGSGWGEWGEISPCSRSCGGGVASQKRICLQVGPDGEPQCAGGDTKYFSCETQDCPPGSMDFRSEQCAQYNNASFRGIIYKWEPYTKAPNPCELNCMPHAERFYYRHKPKVADGTRCNDESFDVCVDGVCQRVGCDMMLGSNAQEDKCRQCRGNGANCYTTSGVLDTQDLLKGYNDMLLIPEGATSIRVVEREASVNYLALRSKNGTYYLNGDYHIDFPRSMIIAGALWYYERNQQGLAAPDKLRCLGPTSEPLYLSLLLQDENKGIEYEYSLPSDRAPRPTKRYNWVHEDFTPCSTSCGGGFQTRNVTCRSREELEVVDDTLCDAILKPPTNQTCSTQACSPQWVEGPWSECSKRCGKGGTRSREVRCEKIITSGLPSIVADKECFNLLGPKPELFQECNVNASCPTWFASPWKPCDKLCDEGKTTRDVICYQKVAGRIEVLNDDECDEEKPISEKSCIIQLCDGVDWMVTDWSGCDTCLSKVRTRIALCSTKDGTAVNASFCEYHLKPVLEEPCDTELPPCQVQWYATQWSNCSVECGDGVQTRKVFCGLLEKGSVVVVNDSLCNHLAKYNDTKPCKVPKEQCPSKWFASPWNECDKKCGSGVQYRRVMCFRGETNATDCQGESILDSTNYCNEYSCDRVEKAPATDETDCVDEEYDEVGLDAISSTFDPEFSDMMVSDGVFVGSTSMGASTVTDFDETGSGFEPELSTFAFDSKEGSGDDTTEDTSDMTDTTDDTTLMSEISLNETASTDDFNTTDTSITDETETTDVTTIVSETTLNETEKTDSTSTDLRETTPFDFDSTVNGTGSTANTDTESTMTSEELLLVGSSSKPEDTSIIDTAGTKTVDTSSSTRIAATRNFSTKVKNANMTITRSKKKKYVPTSGVTNTTSSPSSNTSVVSSSDKSTERTSVPPPKYEIVGSEPTATSEISLTESTEITSTETLESTSFDATSESGATELTTAENSISESEETDVTTPGVTNTTSSSSGNTLVVSSSDKSTERSSVPPPKHEMIDSELTSTSEISLTDSTETISTETLESTSSDATSESEATELTTVTESNISVVSSSDKSTNWTSIPSPKYKMFETEPIATLEILLTNAIEILSTEPLEAASSDATSESVTTELTTVAENIISELDITESETALAEFTTPSLTESATTASTEKASEETRVSQPATETDVSDKVTEETSSDSSTDSAEMNVTTISTLAESTTVTESSVTQAIITNTTSESSEFTKTTETDESSEAESSKENGTEIISTFGETNTTLLEETTEVGTTVSSITEESLETSKSDISTSAVTEKISNLTEVTAKESLDTSDTTTLAVESSSDFGSTKLNVTEPTTSITVESTESSLTTEESNATTLDISSIEPPESTTEESISEFTEASTEHISTEYTSTKSEETSLESTESTILETESSTTETSQAETTVTILSNETEATESGTLVFRAESTVGLSSVKKNWTSLILSPKRTCRRKVPCSKSKFGCCPDKKTTATGPFDEGCPKPRTCKESAYGCCADELSPALGPKFEGCPIMPCAESLFGCCLSDNKTAAEGNEQEGCPAACEFSANGCCKDGETAATGPGSKGCPEYSTTVAETEAESTSEKETISTETTSTMAGDCFDSTFGCCFDNQTEASEPNGQGCPCNATEFGCCPDGVSPANGTKMKGCEMTCDTSAFGCCPDGKTPAHGPSHEGCCLLYAFGCCPDNYKPADGPHLEGCGCQHARFGCCPDKVTYARGPNNEGCGCQYTTHGCCPDRYTEASGPNFEGCDCHTYQFGCCPDGMTIAKGAGLQGCHCRQSTYGCCGDGETAASGPDMLGCDCSSSKHGCCPDGITEAKGSKFFGCTDIPENRQASCSLSTDRGTCRNFTVAWFYDAEYGGCSRFWYGGCGGNGNRFITKEECEDICVRPAPQDACKLPQIKGTCTGYHVRWYYDYEREQCSNFIYGGCLGNSNNFESRELCQAQCEPNKALDQCNLPIERGSCSGNFGRWGFNSETRHCEQFIWGGCEGNSNRFGSEAACNLQCIPPGSQKPECSQPQEVGNCTKKEAVWSFSQSENRCVPFYYTGCGGNNNRFDTEESCEEACPSAHTPGVCTLPAETGECANYKERWYYDTADQRCRQFYYGGCGGNDNNFNSRTECENRCSELTVTTTHHPLEVKTQSTDNISASCFLEKDPGPCTNITTRWAYDYTIGKCAVFEYGGCGGNINNFQSKENCEYYCKPVQDICQLPMLAGPCYASQMRWFYDASTDTCSQFTYGGCQGNDNRFETRDDCERRCRTGPSSEVPEVSVAAATKPTVKVDIESRVKETPEECGITSELEDCTRAGEVWYYDGTLSECVAHQNERSGRKCRNTGVFSSQEACERSCGAFKNINVCRYAADPGPCQSFVSKYYFNQTTNTCHEFAYGGCLGGPNRFSSIDECLQICRPEIDPCRQNPEPGNCLTRFTFWFYDHNSDRCMQFIYTGCGGNYNRFESREECEGRCRGRSTTTTTTSVDLVPTAKAPSAADCSIPVSLTPCASNETAFYYDPEHKTCNLSYVGGCGYANTYRSEEECERRCGDFKGTNVCQVSLDAGPCRAAFPKFFWDSASGSCQPYTYGGCGGSANRFSTIDECEEVCGGTGPAPECLALVDTGTKECGRVEARRWHYSIQDAECYVFIYKGCGGNDNNFDNYQECARLCKMSHPHGTNEVVPSCRRSEYECQNLECPYGKDYTTDSEGCRICMCKAPAVNCEPLRQECDTLKCNYGIERLRDDSGCERCICVDNPCADKDCVEGDRCVILPERDPVTQEIRYAVVCRTVNKTGVCPTSEVMVSETPCRNECYDDAHCPNDAKCCSRGCSRLCLEPDRVSTSTATPTIYTTTHTPGIPEAPQVNTETEPEVTATEGGNVTLRCLFHGNPPPKIKWSRHEIFIDGSEGRYRIRSDGALEIVSVYRSDAGVYVCIADNGLGIARQEVYLVVKDSNEVIPECSAFEEHCLYLECPYGKEYTKESNGCRRCSCKPPENVCEPARLKCEALQCPYGVQKIKDENGCPNCQCYEDPCLRNNCAVGEQCVAIAYRDPVTREPHYSAKCKPAVTEAPNCDRFEDECSRLQCGEYGVQRKRTLEGCEQCTCVPVEIDCEPLRVDCERLKCTYGIERTVGADGCERCNCTMHPCSKKTCSEGERCVPVAYRDSITQETQYFTDCRIVNKTGDCPVAEESSAEGSCRRECNDDADCRGVAKCCYHGCTQLCVVPTMPTSPLPFTTTHRPDLPEPPRASNDTVPVVASTEGGKATLRCLFHGNPPPKITWSRNEITIDGNKGRYHILSDNTLEIVSLYRNDSGVYICVAKNDLGSARQEIQLEVKVPVRTHIVTPQATATAGSELSLPCEVDGYPEPEVHWTKDNVRLVANDRIWISGTTISRLTIPHLTVSDSGVYGCHASNAYSSHYSTVQINVKGLSIPAKCTDNQFFANCHLIVRSKFCHHKYYSKFCCKSCMEAGQLSPEDAEMQADQDWTKTRK